MIEVRILFGKAEINYYEDHNELTKEMEEINLKKYTFSTQQECDAFLKGIEEGVGWTEAMII